MCQNDDCPDTFFELACLWDTYMDENDAMRRVSNDDIVLCFYCGEPVLKKDTVELLYDHGFRTVSVCLSCEGEELK